jgi:hypothetical protein
MAAAHPSPCPAQHANTGESNPPPTAEPLFS